MQRSKQQALMFLLGAVLVGGVVGFSADRVWSAKKPDHWSSRTKMYDDLALSEAQRLAMDSLLDSRNCQLAAVMKPVRPQLDSIRNSAHQEIVARLSDGQRARMEMRREEMARRDSIQKARRDSIRAANKTTTACSN